MELSNRTQYLKLYNSYELLGYKKIMIDYRMCYIAANFAEVCQIFEIPAIWQNYHVNEISNKGTIEKCNQ